MLKIRRLALVRLYLLEYKTTKANHLVGLIKSAKRRDSNFITLNINTNYVKRTKINVRYDCQVKYIKKTLHDQSTAYKNSKIKELRNIKTSNPKKFWKYLNGKKKDDVNITVSDAYEHFKTVNCAQDTNDPENNYDISEPSLVPENEEINVPITLKEIQKAVKCLSNNKSSGIDLIVNEHIKYTFDLPNMHELYVKLFNLVFDTGILPEAWLVGKIIPIYKQKGKTKDPSNYRPITLLSCMGKLFTSVINNRLQNFSENHDKISPCQAGFRKGFSTTDHIFSLHVLINLLQNTKKKLFCGFIDLKRAFDSVWRDGLLYKIYQFNITGKCFTLIKNMYNSIKSCVAVNGVTSGFFPSNIGVRQGENLSPFLFSVFLNDLESYLSSNNIYSGVECISQVIQNNMFIFLKLFVLLYADDTVILAESSMDLQSALNLYASYCKLWKLDINISKTKVVVFSKGRLPNYNFTISDIALEVVREYKYLGILFSRTGSFLSAKKHIASQASRAMFSLLKKAKSLLLPIDLQIELFEKTIKPILLYGCEIWGFGNLNVLEQVQLKFLKQVLNLKKSTPNCIVYGETGVLPLKIDIQSRVIGFWAKLVCPSTKSISSKLYFIAKTYFDNQNRNSCFQWFENVRNILISCGFSGFWLNQTFLNKTWLIKATKQKLTDLYINEWENDCQNNTSCNVYRIFKTKFGYEDYLSKVPSKYRKFLIKIRTRNHKLPIETGRWKKIPRELRKCHLCHNDLGDEFHYLLSCRRLHNLRKQYLSSYFCSRPNVYKLQKLMNCKNLGILRKLCLFVKAIFSTL